MITSNRQLEEKIKQLADPGVATFMRKLNPEVDPASIYGVKAPVLQAIVKEMHENHHLDVVLKTANHSTYEAKMMYTYALAYTKDFTQLLAQIDAMIPYLDSWALTDSIASRAKLFRKHGDKGLAYIEKLLVSEATYTVRLGVVLLLANYLDKLFDVRFLERLSKLNHAEYYVEVALAWCFATALIKHYEATLPYLTMGRLSDNVHRMTIQKAIDSYRIDENQKTFLRGLRRKNK